MKILFASGFDIGRLGAIMKKTMIEFNWEVTNAVFNKTYLDRENEVDYVLSDPSSLEELHSKIGEFDFYFMRWLNDKQIGTLGLDEVVTSSNALFKVHGSEARNMGIPENLIEWKANWEALPLTLVSCMDKTVLDNLSTTSIYHIERPLDWSLIPRPRPYDKGNLVLFHSPTNAGAQKDTATFIPIVKKVKGLETMIAENLSYDECMAQRSRANGVFDQFAGPVGTYGMTTVESLAMKIPVFTGLKTWAYAFHPELQDIVTNVNPQTLYHELKNFVEDPKPYQEKARLGYKYVKEVHNSKKIATQYRALIEEITKK